MRKLVAILALALVAQVAMSYYWIAGDGGISGTFDVNGNLLPVVDSRSDIGSATKYWNRLYVDTLFCDTAAGGGIVFSANDSTAFHHATQSDSAYKLYFVTATGDSIFALHFGGRGANKWFTGDSLVASLKTYLGSANAESILVTKHYVDGKVASGYDSTAFHHDSLSDDSAYSIAFKTATGDSVKSGYVGGRSQWKTGDSLVASASSYIGAANAESILVTKAYVDSVSAGSGSGDSSWVWASVTDSLTANDVRVAGLLRADSGMVRIDSVLAVGSGNHNDQLLILFNTGHGATDSEPRLSYNERYTAVQNYDALEFHIPDGTEPSALGVYDALRGARGYVHTALTDTAAYTLGHDDNYSNNNNNRSHSLFAGGTVDSFALHGTYSFEGTRAEWLKVNVSPGSSNVKHIAFPSDPVCIDTPNPRAGYDLTVKDNLWVGDTLQANQITIQSDNNASAIRLLALSSNAQFELGYKSIVGTDSTRGDSIIFSLSPLLGIRATTTIQADDSMMSAHGYKGAFGVPDSEWVTKAYADGLGGGGLDVAYADTIDMARDTANAALAAAAKAQDTANVALAAIPDSTWDSIATGAATITRLNGTLDLDAGLRVTAQIRAADSCAAAWAVDGMRYISTTVAIDDTIVEATASGGGEIIYIVDGDDTLTVTYAKLLVDSLAITGSTEATHISTSVGTALNNDGTLSSSEIDYILNVAADVRGAGARTIGSDLGATLDAVIDYPEYVSDTPLYLNWAVSDQGVNGRIRIKGRLMVWAMCGKVGGI